MKKCPYCGREYSDEYSVCATDQSPLESCNPKHPLPASNIEGDSVESPSLIPDAANKIRARDIQVFVAGALAVWGFLPLARVPFELIRYHSVSAVDIAISVVVGLALPVGIAILLGWASGILLAQIYLWGTLACGCFLELFRYRLYRQGAARIPWMTAPLFLLVIALLTLIHWSRSRRFRNEMEG